MSEVKIPATVKKSIEWLVQLNEDLTNKKSDYKVAVEAVANKFNSTPAIVKLVVKAYESDKITETLDDLNSKIDLVQAVSEE